MEILSPLDVSLLKLGALATSTYFAKSLIYSHFKSPPQIPALPLLAAAKGVQKPPLQPTRSIIKSLDQSQKSCIVFYGSQTGTAERYAHHFSREALEKFGLGCITADLDNYDFVDIPKLSEKHLVVFILATYGEGDPTDNAIAFQQHLESSAMPSVLSDFCYSAFGLGSSSYTHYNAVIRRLDHHLSSRAAQRIGCLGLGDDGKGTLDEDFTAWITSTLPLVASHFMLAEIPRVYRPAFEVKESHTTEDRHVFLGEPNKAQLYGRLQGPFVSQNPLPASITQARELFSSKDRNCLHMELDASGTTMSYDTGDHLAVLPVNSDFQVDLFLGVFGFSSNRHTVIHVAPAESDRKSPIPSITTYDAAARYYLEISGKVSRQALERLSDFATSDKVRCNLRELAADKDRFAIDVTAKQRTISDLLSSLSVTQRPTAVIEAPFSVLLEIIPKLKPRHYSISSSSLVSKKVISITAVVDRKEDLANHISFRGVSTAYLSAIKDRHNAVSSTTHALQTQRHTATVSSPLVWVRRSKFHPPFDPSTPIIMIGPGTGVAPFRGFIHERIHQHDRGRTIGRTILFYGCRNASEDYLYRDEWQNAKTANRMGQGVFDIFTAFSRQPGQPKQYVQDMITERPRAEEIRHLLRNCNARIYICGNAARMAKDVTKALEVVLSEGTSGGKFIEQLKSEGRWSEDVW